MFDVRQLPLTDLSAVAVDTARLVGCNPADMIAMLLHGQPLPSGAACSSDDVHRLVELLVEDRQQRSVASFSAAAVQLAKCLGLSAETSRNMFGRRTLLLSDGTRQLTVRASNLQKAKVGHAGNTRRVKLDVSDDVSGPWQLLDASDTHLDVTLPTFDGMQQMSARQEAAAVADVLAALTSRGVPRFCTPDAEVAFELLATQVARLADNVANNS